MLPLPILPVEAPQKICDRPERKLWPKICKVAVPFNYVNRILPKKFLAFMCRHLIKADITRHWIQRLLKYSVQLLHLKLLLILIVGRLKKNEVSITWTESYYFHPKDSVATFRHLSVYKSLPSRIHRFHALCPLHLSPILCVI